jgi:hypothetical protein
LSSSGWASTSRTALRRNSSVYAVGPRFFLMSHLPLRIFVGACEVSTKPGELQRLRQRAIRGIRLIRGIRNPLVFLPASLSGRALRRGR